MKQKKNTYLFGASMVALTFSLGNNQVAASEGCATIPSCEELGYVGASCPSGTAALKCPFDQSKVFCAKDCEGYTLTSCPANGLCWTCWNGKMKSYGCNTGYILDGNNCVANPCDGYPLTSQNVAHCGSYSSCQSGPTMKYRCHSCSDGYVAGTLAKINNNYSAANITSCIANPCYITQYASVSADGSLTYYNQSGNSEKYKLTSKNDSNCLNSSSYSECKSGSTTYYYCNACKQGYSDAAMKQYFISSTAGKCISNTDYNNGYEYDCPASKGWSTTIGVQNYTGAANLVACRYKYSCPGAGCWDTMFKYRPNVCMDGYHMNYNTMRCDKN